MFHLGCDDSVNWAAVAPVGDGQWAALLQVVGLLRWLRKEERQAIQRRNARAYIRPLQSTQCCACHAKPPETKRRQGVHSTLAEHQVLRLPRKSHPQRRLRNARAYIRLAEHPVLRLPRTSHQKSSRDQRTSDLCGAPSAAEVIQHYAETGIPSQNPRDHMEQAIKA